MTWKKAWEDCIEFHRYIFTDSGREWRAVAVICALFVLPVALAWGIVAFMEWWL